MKATMTKRTSLTKTANFRATQDDSSQDKYLEGYFIRFNETTNLYADQFETVSPKAVPDDINKQDVRALFDHDTSKVLGRTESGTLSLRKDDEGLYGKILVNQEDSEALSIYAKVKRGDVSQASFGFYITDYELETKEDGDYTTLTGIELFEISIVTFPAYPTTDVGARSKDIESLKKERLAMRKSKLIKELKTKWTIQS